MTKNWYITGTSRGFGREFAITALERGDRVAATARNLSSLDDLVQKYGDALLPLELDVTDKAAVGETVRRAHEAFGSLDVVVNNAGYGHFGAVEELSEQEIRDQLETNFFGALWVTQAVLPILREQGSGHIIQISTIGGVGAFPNIGAYHASKWALEGLTEALSKEVAELGIKVTLVEPGGFSTDWAGDSAKHSTPMPAYDHVREANARRRAAATPGDPVATGPALLTIVDADEPPLRVFFGSAGVPMAHAIYQERLATWDAWQHVSDAAQGEVG